MNNAAELQTILNLERIEENIYRAKNYKAPWGRIFGGQVLSQSLQAAFRTVPEERCLHSMHAYFLLAGDINIPVIYQVDRIRDGGSFTTRRVVVIQKGRPIFNMAASFQLEQEGFDHQITIPNVPPPEALRTDSELAMAFKDQFADLVKYYQIPRPIEFRPVEKFDWLSKEASSPYRHVWMRAKGAVPDDRRLSQAILAYASDYNLLTTALNPHKGEVDFRKVFLASLDHAMWFHRDFRMDEWLLYALDSPSAGNTRGFTRGNIFNREGKLVASVVQEGLIRIKR